ncbi:hypothetical protein FF1_031882 [Malus domestica]
MEVSYYGMPLGFRFHPTDQELDLFFFYELRSRSNSDSRSKRQIKAGGTWSETFYDKVLGLDGIPIRDKGHFMYNNKGSNNNGATGC